MIAASRAGGWRLAFAFRCFLILPISTTLLDRSFSKRKISSSMRSISFRYSEKSPDTAPLFPAHGVRVQCTGQVGNDTGTIPANARRPLRFTCLRDNPRQYPSAIRSLKKRSDSSRKEGGDRFFEMIEGQFCGLAPTAGSFEKSGLNQVGFMHIFEGALIFMKRSRQRFHPNRSSSKLVDDGQKNLTVHFVKPRGIDTQPGKCVLGDSLGNLSRRLDLSIVAHPLDQPIHDAWGSSRTSGNFPCAFGCDRNPEHPRRACHDGLQLRWRIKLQPVDKAKSVSEWGSQGPSPGRRSNQRKPRKIQFPRSGRRPLTDHEIELIVLHRWIERLLDRGRKSVNLVDE